MPFEDKTQNNILIDLKAEVGADVEEGTLLDHSFRGAAAEFERTYIELGLIERNGYAETADREHLIMRAKERNIEPFAATHAVWKAEFDTDIPTGSRFFGKDLTYVCTEAMETGEYRLTCEQSGTKGNVWRGELSTLDYIEGFGTGKLTELLVPARDDESTESFRTRYLSAATETRSFGGNRAQYRQIMYDTGNVGACKIYRASGPGKRIRIFFLDSAYQVPSDSLVANLQEIIDPVGKQGDGQGEAAMFHVVDICPCERKTIDIEADIMIDTGCKWEEMMPEIEAQLDGYYLELAKKWENEEYITVRILKINAAIASVEGIIDVQETTLNGKSENIELNPNAVPVKGAVLRRKKS